MNKDILVVNINNMELYDYLKEDQTKEELLTHANQSRAKEIKIWKNQCRLYPDAECFKNKLIEAEKKKYKLMTWAEYEKLERNFYINRPVIETTEEKFNEMRNISLPKYQNTIHDIEMFCASEILIERYADQYTKKGDKYYTKIVDITDETTWIHNFI